MQCPSQNNKQCTSGSNSVGCIHDIEALSTSGPGMISAGLAMIIAGNRRAETQAPMTYWTMI